MLRDFFFELPFCNVIKKLYMPFIREKDYNKNLHQNISDVKKDTRNSSILNHYLNKKNKDIGNLAKELAIYDNPSKIIFILIRN